MKIVIGIDPDADKNGVAIFIDGHLSELKSLATLQIYYMLMQLNHDKKVSSLLVAIEDVKSRGATFSREDRKGGHKVMNKIAQNVGQCKHAQTEVERCCEMLEVEIKHFAPSKAFKEGSQIDLFKQMTKYKGKSNADQRSAAYFGLLGLRFS